MKRTTIMVEEALLYDLQRIARSQKKTSSAVVREALEAYVADQHEKSPPANPLMALIGLFDEGESTDMSDGADEEILRQGVHPIYGWGKANDDTNGHEFPVRADEPKRRSPRAVRTSNAKPARKPKATRDRAA